MSGAVAVQPGDTYALRNIKDARHRTAAAARAVADWLAQLELEGKRPRTLSNYEQTAAVLLRTWPDRPLEEFTAGDLMQLLRRFPVRGRHIRRAHLQSLFAWAELTRTVEDNPMRLVPKIRKPKVRHKPTFTEAEVALLTGLPLPDGPLMSILFLTGLRISEAINLRAKHIDFGRERLVVYSGKGDKDRVVRMRRLVGLLDHYLTVEGIERDEYLWYTRPAGKVTRRREPLTPNSFYIWWNRSLAAAGVDPGRGRERRTVHSARHSFATNWIRKGGSIETLSLTLGHSSIETTYSTYVHLDTEDVLAALELVEG